MVVAANLVAHAFDMNIDCTRVARKIEAPDIGEQLLAREHDPGIGREAV